MSGGHGDVREITSSMAEMLRPPSRMLPIEAVQRYLRTENGPYSLDLTPMMAEPLNYMASREYRGICVIGPARSGKTLTLVIGALVYIVMCAPGDTQITQMSQDAAREFSKKDIDRMLRYSTEVGEKVSPRPRDNNVFDKFFRSGMALTIAWPTVTQHSGKTLRYQIFTDYDRPENRDDVDGEGPLYWLGDKRTQTYLSRGKTLAESSPGGGFDPKDWRPQHPHEGPPAGGIMTIYNNGTRARWYWPCFVCGERFEAAPGLGCFRLPPFEELRQGIERIDFVRFAEQHAFVTCPHCAGVHRMDQKREMNLRGKWVHQGESIDGAGRITGERLRSSIVSYWQGGAAAGYQPWSDIILRYLQGIRDFVATGDDSALKSTTNTDQAMPFVPVALQSRRNDSEFSTRVEDWPRGLVPAGVHFITQSVDVQKNGFIVHAYGWGEGGQSWLIDRWKITGSARPEGESFAAIEPQSYLEDWEVLIEQVMLRQYPMASDTSGLMRAVVTFCDSGGAEGVTNNAYDFWRKLSRASMGNRFRLCKGAASPDAPRWEQTFPDSRGRNDRRSNARGDVPVYMLNTNVFKDVLDGAIKRADPGPHYMHVPRWIDPDFYKELAAEERDPRTNRWVNRNNRANHAIDLDVYARAAAVILGIERINWTNPPPFCGPEKRDQPTPYRPARGRGVRGGGVEL